MSHVELYEVTCDMSSPLVGHVGIIPWEYEKNSLLSVLKSTIFFFYPPKFSVFVTGASDTRAVFVVSNGYPQGEAYMSPSSPSDSSSSELSPWQFHTMFLSSTIRHRQSPWKFPMIFCSYCSVSCIKYYH